MISLPSAKSFYLYGEPTDMRKSFNGLGGIVINELGKDLLSGDAFIFINKRRTLVKILVWDRTGFVIYYKKLSSGTIELPEFNVDQNQKHVPIRTLMMMLEGVEIKSARMRKRFNSSNKKRA